MTLHKEVETSKKQGRQSARRQSGDD